MNRTAIRLKLNLSLWIAFWVLVSIMMIGLAMGLSESIPELNSGLLLASGSISLMMGWQLGRTKGRNVWILFTGFITGWLFLSLILSGALAPIWQAFHQFLRPFSLFQSPSLFPPGTEQVLSSIYAAAGQWIGFWQEVYQWAKSLILRSGFENKLAIRFFWGLLSWFTLFLTGWLFRKKAHGFYAALPVLLLLAVVLGYTRQNTLGLIMALGAWLGLTALSEHLKREQTWQRTQTDYSEELRFDLALLGIPIIAGILLVAGVIPNFSIDDLQEFFQDTFTSRSEDSVNVSEPFGLDPAPEENASSSPGVLPRSFLLDAGPDLTDMVVMRISPPQNETAPDPGTLDRWSTTYWFGRAYDIYTGQGWQTGATETSRVPPSATITNPDPYAADLTTVNITRAEQLGSTLYSPGRPVSVSQPVSIDWHSVTGDYVAGQTVSANYVISAWTLAVPSRDLLSSNLPAPDAIRSIYLSLPETLPNRVRELAASITSTAVSPYEKATAIADYLRSYDYSLDIPLPPSDQDVVDYFLFDLKKGYCDYYASAMVVMARAEGLPARIAVGYAGGFAAESQDALLVTEAQAHAWVEVYIAPYGWIPFEPTPSLPEISRQANPFAEETPAGPSTIEDFDDNQNPFFPNIPLSIPIITAIIAISAGLWFLVRHYFSTSDPGLRLIKIHQRYTRLFSRLFTRYQPSDTLLEYQEKIESEIAVPARKRAWELRWHSRFLENLSIFTNEVNHSFFAPDTLTTEKIKKLRSHWRKLRRLALFIRFIYFFN